MCLAVDFEDSLFLASCLTLLAGYLSKSMLESLMILETNPSSFKKNQKIPLCKILAVSHGFLARDNWACTALYLSSTEWLPSMKLVSMANLALSLLVCGLQKSSNLANMTSKLRSSGSKHHDRYWSIPKSPLHAMTFLHFLESGNMASSQSNMFSHFSFHLRNLCYKISFTVQSIFGPSIYGINMDCIKGCGWLIDGWINYWSFLMTTCVNNMGRILCSSGHLRTLDICSQATSQ